MSWLWPRGRWQTVGPVFGLLFLTPLWGLRSFTAPSDEAFLARCFVFLSDSALLWVSTKIPHPRHNGKRGADGSVLRSLQNLPALSPTTMEQLNSPSLIYLTIFWTKALTAIGQGTTQSLIKHVLLSRITWRKPAGVVVVVDQPSCTGLN